jgi:hypothetical protein
MGYEKGIAISHSSFGSIHEERGDVEHAEDSFKKALALFEAIGDQERVDEMQESIKRLADSGAPKNPESQ